MTVPIKAKSGDATTTLDQPPEQTKKQSAISLGLSTSSSLSSAKEEGKRSEAGVAAAKKNPPINAIQVTSAEFSSRGFFNCKAVAIDEIKAHERSITSIGMVDCITLFGINRQDEKVFAFHIVSLSDEEDVYVGLEDFLEVDDDDQFDLYIIGGNEASIKAGLPTSIENAVANFFGDQAEIVCRFLNPPKTEAEPYVAANLQVTGELTYCTHQEI